MLRRESFKIFTVRESPALPGEWFALEVIAEGKHVVVKVNGKTTVDHTEEMGHVAGGHIALQQIAAETVAKFRKIEIKELPPTKTENAPSPTFKNSLGMEFVLVPKGKSWLGGGGGTVGAKEVEIPQDFYLGKYEVTQEEWHKVTGLSPSHFSREGAGTETVKNIPDAELKRFPVEQVSWNDAQLFLKLLNAQAKETGWKYRLPKEAEWEYACRGGSLGDKLDSAFDFYFEKPTNYWQSEQANFKHLLGLMRTCKVGSYKPNRLVCMTCTAMCGSCATILRKPLTGPRFG